MAEDQMLPEQAGDGDGSASEVERDDYLPRSMRWPLWAAGAMLIFATILGVTVIPGLVSS